MKTEQPELKVIVHGELDITKMPKDILDAFADAIIEEIEKMNPERIVYVSCDSATLARDLKWLEEHGYKLKEATPCDMFGQTVHVETVAWLEQYRSEDANHDSN